MFIHTAPPTRLIRRKPGGGVLDGIAMHTAGFFLRVVPLDLLLMRGGKSWNGRHCLARSGMHGDIVRAPPALLAEPSLPLDLQQQQYCDHLPCKYPVGFLADAR